MFHLEQQKIRDEIQIMTLSQKLQESNKMLLILQEQMLGI